MNHDDLLKSVIYVVPSSDTPCADTSIYSVFNRKIPEITIKLGSVQEERDIPLLEYETQQQIYRWVRTNINLPSVQGQTYTEGELCQAYERRILDKSRYYEILVKFGVPNYTLTYFLKVIFLPLKSSSMKHLWYLMGVGKITKRIVIELI